MLNQNPLTPDADTHGDFYLTNSAASLQDLYAETSVPWYRREIPTFAHIDEAQALLHKLSQRPPQVLLLAFDMDRDKFSDMRASVLACGVVALAVQQGHRAVISARSAKLPLSHWRAEFIFRAVAGIRKLQPQLDTDAILAIVTQAIHFCEAADEPELQLQTLSQ